MSAGPEGDDRAELRAEVRRCLERHTDLRPYVGQPDDVVNEIDSPLWSILGTQMGLAGLIVPESDGGSGATIADLGVVFEELGATLAPVPLFATAGLALPAVLTATAGERSAGVRDLLSGIVAGSTVATLAINELDGGYGLGATTVRAGHADGGWTLTGAKSFVVDGHVANVVLVPAKTDAGVGLFAVDRSSPGVRMTGMPSLDLLRPLAAVRFDAAPARPIAVDGDVADRLRAGLDLSLVLLSAEQVGGAQRCLDNAVEYAKQRIQFDRPIGSFQAMKHQLVNLLLEVEMARSAMTNAVRVADDYLLAPSTETARALAEAASLARALCSETYSHVADEALHIHGGIGFTWEHDSHLYYRRAKSAELLFGTPDEHRERLAFAAGL